MQYEIIPHVALEALGRPYLKLSHSYNSISRYTHISSDPFRLKTCIINEKSSAVFPSIISQCCCTSTETSYIQSSLWRMLDSTNVVGANFNNTTSIHT